MQQTLFDLRGPSNPVNVASVPKRSPFRFPGGKTWLTPWIRLWLSSKKTQPQTFVDAFAGGGSVSLTVAFEKLCRRVIMVELDEDVASVWRTILGDGGKWLAQSILDFQLTTSSAKTLIESRPKSDRERAFQTIVRNRICHGGILAAGSGVLKFGENGRGIHSRWYPDTIARRIIEIQKVKENILFIHGDTFEVIPAYVDRETTCVFMDPPYTIGGKKAGSRLYTHFMVDHEKLFDLANSIRGDFLMTYDVAPEVAEFAYQHGFDLHEVPMTNTHHARMTELLVSRSLDWAR